MSNLDFLFFIVLFALCHYRINKLNDRVKNLEITVCSLSVWIGKVSERTKQTDQE